MIIASIAILLVAFLVYASYNIRSNIYLKVFSKHNTTEKIVAITFDDGPDSVQTPRVLQVLKDEQAPACFFCIGKKIKGNEPLIRQIIAEGHLIGNHSFTHAYTFPLYSRSRMVKELQACQVALEEVTSQKIDLFRPPFGVTNPTIAQVCKKLDYTPIGWNIRTLDTQQPSTQNVLRRIQKKLCPGTIILLHDRMPDSDLLLKAVLNYIKEQGYTVVRLDKMMYNTPKPYSSISSLSVLHNQTVSEASPTNV